MNVLIVTKNELIDRSKDDILVSLDENNQQCPDILCFLPNRNIVSKSPQFLCFIPYSRDNDWNYKQNARALRYKIGNDCCQILETDFSYPVHKKIGLSYDEEVSLLLLTIEFFLDNNANVTISHKIDLSEKQSLYLNKLINDKKVTVLYE